MESEIVGVVSLSTTEISEMKRLKIRFSGYRYIKVLSFGLHLCCLQILSVWKILMLVKEFYIIEALPFYSKLKKKKKKPK